LDRIAEFDPCCRGDADRRWMHLCRARGANQSAGSGKTDDRSSRGVARRLTRGCASGIARIGAVAVTRRQTGGFARRLARGIAGSFAIGGRG
jgi:hypothetical protein